MKYLKKFENHTAYEAYIASGYVRPNVSYCVQESDVYYNPMTMADKYLTFTALEDTTFKLTIGSAVSESILSSISYSTDNGETWTTTNNVNSQTVTITTPTINTGNKVLWKGIGTGVSTTIVDYSRPSTSSIFSSSGEFNVEGNIMSLIYGDDFSDKDSVDGTYNFALLFYSYNMTDKAKVVSAKDMVFPIKSVPTCCYFRMFQSCPSLVEAPLVIDAESVGNSGCSAMFWGCENLKATPKLQATTLGVESCRAMFETCTGLETVAEIPTATSADITSYYSIFNQCKNLTSVDVPSGITVISDWAFSNCYSLTSVTISDSVTSIGENAFYTCSGLTSATIGSGVTSIGKMAFANCRGLTSIDLPSGLITIGEYAFASCHGLISVTIPDSVTNISGSAFSMCESLTSITIPSGVTSIGEDAFEYCSGLTSIIIPSGVTSIGDNPFNHCSSLTAITVDGNNNTYDSRNNCNAIIETSTNKLITGCKNTIMPNAITSIGNNAFGGCSDLTSIDIPSGVTSIGEYAFYECSGLTSITIPDSVISIGLDMCGGCTLLSSATIGSGITSISSRAFEYCSRLTSIDIPSGITSIGEYAFYKCSGLTSITIPSGVTSISGYTFQYCKGLTSVTIPSGVTFMGMSAFRDCTNLASITSLATTAPSIQSSTFQSVKSGGTLYVPTGSTGYDKWMRTTNYYLGKYNWTKVEQ